MLDQIFIKPVAKLSLDEIIFILAFAIIFDFFWQFVFRYLVVIFGKARQKIYYMKFIALENKSHKTIDRIEKLKNELQNTEPPSKTVHTKILKSLAKTRKQKTRLLNLVNAKRSAYEPFEPFVSIIIPCHNSEDVLENTLINALIVNYKNKEIIVIDDGSTDGTHKVASKFQDKINVLKKEKCSGRKTGAINFGLAFAKGDYIIVIDDDTIVEPDSIEALMKPFRNDNVAAVGGNIRVMSSTLNLLTQLQSIEYLSMMQVVKPFQAFFYNNLFVISGGYGAFRKEALNNIGSWDIDTITEDLDITWKLYRMRKQVLYSDNAVCHTEVPSALKALIKQRIRWDHGLFESIRKHQHFLLSKRFPGLGMGLLLESIFMEIVLIAARPLYIIFLVVSGTDLLTILILTLYFYLALEFAVIFSTGLLSDNKKFCLKAFYAPIMMLYHQLMAVIRIWTLFRFATNKKIEW